jgi:hypothetical protein
MAVIFSPDSYVISVKTDVSPAEHWLETQREMLDLLHSEDETLISKRCHYIELLQSMLPDLETAEKMTK